MVDMRSRDPIVVSGIGLASSVASSVLELCAVNACANVASVREDWFDATRYFGRRGHKYFTPATLYLLAAVQDALSSASITDDRYSDVDRGVLIGTNFADAAVREELDRILLAEGTAGLSPAYAANSSANIPASNISIRNACRAFNITLTNPVVAGIEAILAAKRSIEAGRARFVLAGATEPTPPPAALQLCGARGRGAGACVFGLERAGDATKRLGVIAGGTTRFVPPASLEDPQRREGIRAGIGREILRLFEGEPSPKSVHLYRVPAESVLSRFVTDAAKDALSSSGIDATDAFFAGNDASLMSVSPLLQLAGILHQQIGGLIIATSPYGHVAILRAAPTV